MVVAPALTRVWRRRVVAAALDLAIVLTVLVLLVVLQVERFSRDAGGLFAPADFDRIAALTATVHQQIEIAGTRYVLAGAELVMTVLVTALTALVVHVALPGATGTSPGKRVVGLQVVTLRGGVVDRRDALVRTVVGLVDLLPLVVPGLLGARWARRSPLGQRLGDRVAGTVVVDARQRLVLTTAAEPWAQASGASVAPAAGGADDDPVPAEVTRTAVEADGDPVPTELDPVASHAEAADVHEGHEPSTGPGRDAEAHRPKVIAPANGMRTWDPEVGPDRRRSTGGNPPPPPRHRRGPGGASTETATHPLRRADDPKAAEDDEADLVAGRAIAEHAPADHATADHAIADHAIADHVVAKRPVAEHPGDRRDEVAAEHEPSAAAS
jgi:uncharacterized RDD family membrane protein YckC